MARNSKDLNRMNIRFSKDMESYKTGFFKGFTMGELISVFVGILICVLLWIFLIYKVNMNGVAAVYISIIPAVPIVLTGFYKQSGMGLIEIVRKKHRLRKMGLLVWSSTETIDNFNSAWENSKNILCGQAEKNIEEYNFEKFVRKIKYTILFLILIIIAAVISVIVYFL